MHTCTRHTYTHMHTRIHTHTTVHTLSVFICLFQSLPRTSPAQTKASHEVGVAVTGRWPTPFAVPPTVHLHQRPPLPLNGGSTRVMVRVWQDSDEFCFKGCVGIVSEFVGVCRLVWKRGEIEGGWGGERDREAEQIIKGVSE